MTMFQFFGTQPTPANAMLKSLCLSQSQVWEFFEVQEAVDLVAPFGKAKAQEAAEAGKVQRAKKRGKRWKKDIIHFLIFSDFSGQCTFCWFSFRKDLTWSNKPGLGRITTPARPCLLDQIKSFPILGQLIGQVQFSEEFGEFRSAEEFDICWLMLWNCSWALDGSSWHWGPCKGSLEALDPRGRESWHINAPTPNVSFHTIIKDVPWK